MVAQKVIEFGPVWDLPAGQYELALSMTILGEPGRKSNQRRIVRNNKTGKAMLIKSQKALDYSASFLAQVPEETKRGIGGPKEPLALWAVIHYASNRPDVSTELIQDLLEKAGVISNDRHLKQLIIFGSIDRENPRVELRLYRILTP